MNGKLNIKMRKKIAKCYEWRVRLYGCETRAITSRHEAVRSNRNEYLVGWTDKKSNLDVLNQVGEKAFCLIP